MLKMKLGSTLKLGYAFLKNGKLWNFSKKARKNSSFQVYGEDMEYFQGNW